MPSTTKMREKPAEAPKTLDLEVKDAQLIFDAVWAELEEEFGEDNLRFPREIIWLNGSPGAGKGTQTRFIMRLRDITAKPVVVSSLLKSPEAKRLMDAGLMVGDKEVARLAFRELLNPVYQNGVVVDGYPRTNMQVHCVKLLYRKLKELRKAHLDSPLKHAFRKPIFHIIVLFIDESESVDRQLYRGREIMKHNEQVGKSGVGAIREVRKTDLTQDAARDRYRIFKEITYESLKTLREAFHYHFINAQGSIREVEKRIVNELGYQSSLELDEATYDRLSPIPLASQLAVHARQELIKRLEGYEARQTALFKQVVEMIEEKFMPIIRRHGITGMAYINSEDPLFEDPSALAMVIDVFSERGFNAVADVRRYEVPQEVDRESFRIINRVKKVYRFRICFPGSEIRRDR